MKALVRHAPRDLRLEDVPDPGPHGRDEVRVAIDAIGLNHIDLWGHRGMAFAPRTRPVIVGAEAAGTVEAVGPGVTHLAAGQRVALYAGTPCGHCAPCRAGRDNLCEDPGGPLGFLVDGVACEAVRRPARLCVPIPDGVTLADAACAPVCYGTVQHMLFDNARLAPDETILVQAGASGVGSAAIQMAKKAGCRVLATVGDDAKRALAARLGADVVVNYRTERFEARVLRETGRRGVDVVFEHVGPDTWAGSQLCLARGGRLVTCGATTGRLAETNLAHLYQRQQRLIGSFGCTIRNVAEALARIADGTRPVIDRVLDMARFEDGLGVLERREVQGKILLGWDACALARDLSRRAA